jgi:hypothetical protein
LAELRPPNLREARFTRSLGHSGPRFDSFAGQLPDSERTKPMSYIPKQIKRERDRVEVKLDLELVRQLERYCQYLESDRDYVISQALTIAFNKDKDFAEWLKSQPAGLPAKTPIGIR